MVTNLMLRNLMANSQQVIFASKLSLLLLAVPLTLLANFQGFAREDGDEEKPVIGFWSAFTWLVGMTLVISVLSEYVVGTIEDMSLGIAMGSATQISMFVTKIQGPISELNHPLTYN